MLRIYTRNEDGKYIVAAHFYKNITEYLQKIMAFCLKNSLNFYVSYNELCTYEVKVDIDKLIDPKVKALIDFLNDIRRQTDA